MESIRHVLISLFLVSSMTGSARAQGRNITIERLDFVGVEQVDERELRGAMETRERPRVLFWRGPPRHFDRREFEADLARVEAFYRAHGFPDARVTHVDLRLNDSQDQIEITIYVHEGEPIVVEAIELRGFDVLPERVLRDLPRTLPLQKDQPLDRRLMFESRERSRNVLRDHGYPYAEVTVSEELAGSRERRVVYRAAPGMLARFGPIEVTGLSTVDEEVIHRELTYAPGDLFVRRKMRESQRKLYRLEVFEFVNIESLENRERPTPDVPTTVNVLEGDHRRVLFGLGYGTEEQVRARLGWAHTNLFGRAHHVRVLGRWSSLELGARVDYRMPHVLHSNLSLNVEAQNWHAAEPVYSVTARGGRLVWRHQAVSDNEWSVTFLNEYQRSVISTDVLDPTLPENIAIRDELIALGLDPRTGRSEGTVSALAFDISRSTVDNPIDARSGYTLAGRAERAGPWLNGTFSYLAAAAEGRHYLPLGSRLLLANRLRLGSIHAYGDLEASVPFYKRYFLGGSSSVRGWGRFEVGPISSFGLPVGGHSMLEGSSELRCSIWRSLSAVAFLDYGNVWLDSWHVDVTDLRYAVGSGVRYRTPIGPLRMDVGYQLNPIPGLRLDGAFQKRRWRLHFSVGQAF